MNKVMNRVSKNLFHLGKALWNEIPGGSLVAALYDANEDLLLEKIDEAAEQAGLTEDDLGAIGKLVGSMEKTMDRRLDESEATILGELARIEESLLAAIEASSDVNVQVALREQLDAVKKTRETWVERLSNTQRQFLELLPIGKDNSVSRRSLIASAQSSIGKLTSARYEEMNLRLHELRWLGLIDRDHREDDWYYWRVIAPLEHDVSRGNLRGQ